jgi:hypothetical protein
MSDRESLSFVDVAPSLGMVEQHRLMALHRTLGVPGGARGVADGARRDRSAVASGTGPWQVRDVDIRRVDTSEFV